MSSGVSVVLCTFNGERWLPDLLASLEAQELAPDEIIVCDDSSTDGTVAIIESFARTSRGPVRIVRNERNLGSTQNFAKGIDLATSPLIALCDQDDVWYPAKLRRSVEAFDGEGVGFVFGDGDLIDENGSLLGRRLWDSVGFVERHQAEAKAGDLLPLLVHYTFVTGATMTFRAGLREVVVPIPDGWFHDAWIALVATMIGDYRLISEPLLGYRVHGSQVIGVPEGPVTTTHDSWTTRWSLRLRQVSTFRDVADVREKRRDQAKRYREVVDRIGTAADRYMERHDRMSHPRMARALSEIAERAEHLERRADLPSRRRDRIATVVGELRNGRYRRFSAGIFSAVQDLIA